jgi:hypothetical protein
MCRHVKEIGAPGLLSENLAPLEYTCCNSENGSTRVWKLAWPGTPIV